MELGIGGFNITIINLNAPCHFLDPIPIYVISIDYNSSQQTRYVNPNIPIALRTVRTNHLLCSYKIDMFATQALTDRVIDCHIIRLKENKTLFHFSLILGIFYSNMRLDKQFMNTVFPQFIIIQTLGIHDHFF